MRAIDADIARDVVYVFVCLSVCVCLARPGALQKRLNRSRCRCGARLARPQRTMCQMEAHMANTIERFVLGDDPVVL